MKQVLPLLVLAMSLPLFAQTGTFTVGVAQCSGYPNTGVIGQSVSCFGVPFYTNGVLSGYVTYDLNQSNGLVTSGSTWRYNAYDQQTGYATKVSGTINFSTQTMTFSFSNGGSFSGRATIGYRFVTYCTRYGCKQRIYTTSGTVSFN